MDWGNKTANFSDRSNILHIWPVGLKAWQVIFIYISLSDKIHYPSRKVYCTISIIPMDYEINGTIPDLWCVGNQQCIATTFCNVLGAPGMSAATLPVYCPPWMYSSLQLLKSQSCMSWISLHFAVWRKNPRSPNSTMLPQSLLHLQVRGLFSHTSTGAELCQQQKRLHALVVNDEYSRCTSQWSAKRKELEKE